MKHQRTLRRVAVALMLLVAFLFQGTWALAGTVGSITGTVTTKAGQPLAGALVKADSPSEVTAAVTDAHGHFQFLGLSPDTYTVTAEKAGYNTISLSGITVFADQTQTVSLVTEPALKTIATVKSVSAGNLVKPGTTASVYTVTSAVQKLVASNSGGNNLDTAYSAIYSQPGVTTTGNGAFGFGQTFYIRGASYSQTGYEFDGVPVNRAFDNYSANSLSNVGVASTEIYTGGSPADASSATLGGYIDQTIKSGTYPGYGKAEVTLGYPGYRHGLYVQAGGATPNRLFSYYVGLSSMNYIPNFINNQNGGNLNPDGSNAYGLQSLPAFYNSGSALYGVNEAFTRIHGGPLTTCLPNGTAPAGSMTATGSDLLFGIFGPAPVPVCGVYAPLNEAVATAFQYGTGTRDTENVFNFHFALPHKKDAGRDDIQLLYDVYGYHTIGYDNINTAGTLGLLQNAYAGWGGPTGYASVINGAFNPPGFSYPTYGGAGSAYANVCGLLGVLSSPGTFGTNPCATNGGSPLAYADSLYYPAGSVAFGSSAAAAAGKGQPYLFPSSPQQRLSFQGISPGLNSGIWNDGSIIKLQYQKNINERSFLRLYGYTFYSDWLQNDPNGAANGLGLLGIGYASSSDYELSTHSRGLGFEYDNQLNDKNMLTFAGNYVTASTVRWNNSQPNTSPGNTPAATLQTASGACYSFEPNTITTGIVDPSYSPGSPAGIQVSCLSPLAGQPISVVNSGTLPGIPPSAAAVGANWLFTSNIGANGNRNSVTPTFYTLSLNDGYTPTSKLNFNLGFRYESYKYGLAQFNDAESNFWVNQFNTTACVDPAGLSQASAADQLPSGTSQSPLNGYPANLTTAPGAPCPVDGITNDQLYHPGSHGVPLLNLASTNSLTKATESLRLGGTYTINPDTVVRFSAGRYVQPTETAFEQVLTYTDGYDTARNLFNSSYYNLGLASTVHDNPLQYSNNYDISLEKHLKGTDITFRLTPYYRYTSDQLVTTPLPGGLAGGFNAATQKSSGVELALQVGNPANNGFAGALSYTYAHVRQKFSLINGSNNITVLQQNLKSFFNLTKSNGGSPCYQLPGLVGAPTGPIAGVSCSTVQAPGAYPIIANPYYTLYPNTTYSQYIAQFDPNGYYPTYANYFPNGTSGDPYSAIAPNTFTGYLTYKKNRLMLGANFDLQEGTRYGSPFTSTGVNPLTCGQNQGSVGIVPGSQLPDYQSCTGSVPIPDPATGTFDGIGQFREPWQLNIGAQATYELNPKVSTTLTIANLVNRCFGGTKMPWSSAYPANNITCSYAPNGSFPALGSSFLGYIPGAANNVAGAGYYYGSSPTATQNGTAGYPNVFNYPYTPYAFGGLPIQVYFQVNVKV